MFAFHLIFDMRSLLEKPNLLRYMDGKALVFLNNRIGINKSTFVIILILA